MFWQIGEMKKIYDKYKKLQDSLKHLVIRAKSWGNDDAGVIIEMTAEMKVKEITINDQDLLSPARKQELEQAIKTCFQKAQQKAQEVAAEKTKEILWFDPSNIASMLSGWGMPNIPWIS